MSSYRPIDSKREEFRKYLERTGVMDALTKALVALYEEPDKPEDALGIQSCGNGGKTQSSVVEIFVRRKEWQITKKEEIRVYFNAT